MEAIDDTKYSVDNLSSLIKQGEDTEEQLTKPPYPPELAYDKWSSLLTSIIGTHNTEVVTIVDQNRRARTLDLDVEDLQRRNELDKDETIIPIRVIDVNIDTELPPYIRYLTVPPRVAIFKDPKNPSETFADAETAFTAFVKYQNWIIPVYQVLDGSALNGIDAIELCACEATATTPGGFEFHAIADDNLILPEGTINIQDSPIVGVRLKVSIIKLESFKTNARFNSAAVSSLLESLNTSKSTAKFDLVDIYKFYFKVGGVVYTAFYCEKYTQGWLADPKLLNLGVTVADTRTVPVIDPLTGLPQINPIQGVPEVVQEQFFRPVEETEYPIYVLRKKLKEEKPIRSCLGRGVLDLASQSAQTILTSAFVNGTQRATNVSASPDGEVEPGTSLEMLDVNFEHGRIWSRPLKYHQPPYPPMDVLRGATAIDVRQKADMGKQSVAADNRVDSRKTAREIEAAASMDNQLNSVSVTIFASWWASILNACWRIVRSKAIEGKLVFCPHRPDYLEREFILAPAGDSDYLQKEERIKNFEEFWPMLVNFPQVAATILSDIIKEIFPERGAYYADILLKQVAQGNNNYQQVSQGLFMMLETLLQNPQVANLPEAQQILPKIQELKQVFGQQQSQQPQQPQQPQPQ